MKTVQHEVKQKVNGKEQVVATLDLQCPENLTEAVELYGGEANFLDYAFRSYKALQGNKHRPGASQATGAKKFQAVFKSLSPEVRNALKNKSPEELEALLTQAGLV